MFCDFGDFGSFAPFEETEDCYALFSGGQHRYCWCSRWKSSSRSGTYYDVFLYCWRAVARQLSIPYNSEIWPKSVGCKIVDLRSRMRYLYPGASGFGDMRSRFRATAVIKDTLNKVSFYIDVCCLWKDSSRS